MLLHLTVPRNIQSSLCYTQFYKEILYEGEILKILLTLIT